MPVHCTQIENLQRCESLTKLDLTVNFIDKKGLLSIDSLAANYKLRDLYLTGSSPAETSRCEPDSVAGEARSASESRAARTLQPVRACRPPALSSAPAERSTRIFTSRCTFCRTA